jgi:transcriptional regulator with XRE-family HTH domain
MDNAEQLSLSRKEKLLEELKDAEYRRGLVEGHAKDTIAFQLRVLRKAQGWEQRDVAERLGNPNLQPMISRYENPDYGRYSISTLLELASVFDVALIVRFAPFSELIEWDWTSNAATLCPASFGNDGKLTRLATQIRTEQEFNARDQMKPTLFEQISGREQSSVPPPAPPQKQFEGGLHNAAFGNNGRQNASFR